MRAKLWTNFVWNLHQLDQQFSLAVIVFQEFGSNVCIGPHLMTNFLKESLECLTLIWLFDQRWGVGIGDPVIRAR